MNVSGQVFGGQGRNRTTDTRIFSPLLYQLSYLAGPVRPGKKPERAERSADYKGISPARQEFTAIVASTISPLCYRNLNTAGRLNVAAPASQIHIEAALSGFPSTRRS